jgi:hypothetical protein
MVVRSFWPRLALAAIALGGLSAWGDTQDPPARRTWQALELKRQLYETYRQIHGRFPKSAEAMAFMMTSVTDPAVQRSLVYDGWGRSMWVCRQGKTVILLSRGPNGIDDRGGVDDLQIEIE